MKVTNNALILVVEDSADLNRALCDILVSYGYRVHSAHDGHEALAYLHGVQPLEPDVILCDIMMPGMDGYTLLQHTRTDVNLRALPFIFLTALASTADQRRAKEIGIEDYLTKPVDISDLVAAIENALKRRRVMKEETQRKLDDLRNSIVGLLQHEFRTPLTFVLGYAELLANTNPSNLNWDELRLAAAAILDGGQRLRTLIESFLLLAELQNRTLNSGELDRLEAMRLWRNVAQEVKPKAAAARLSLELLPARRPLYITGDAHLIEESLRRLVDNAIRYRRPESRLIRLSVVAVAPYVGLRIQDDGLGIRTEALAELLRPFEQSGRDQRTTVGVGLGLALINHIMRLHGGRLQIESTFGEGSTFTLWLPAAAETTDR